MTKQIAVKLNLDVSQRHNRVVGEIGIRQLWNNLKEIQPMTGIVGQVVCAF